MRPHSAFRPLLSLLFILLLTACGEDAAVDTPSAPAAAPAPKSEAKPVPAFNRDSAYAYVARQVAFGPRMMNTPEHDATGEWLAGKLKEFGAVVELQTFTANGYKGTNIIGRYNPQSTDRLLLAAHWDTRHVADSQLEDDPTAIVMGADDGASGVGVLLEVARQLGLSTPDIGVDIIFLDAEDQGDSGNADSWGLGAQHYAKTVKAPKPRYGILLDMVGARNARFAIEGYSKTNAPEVVKKVWNMAAGMGFGSYFPKEDGSPGVTDDHFFIMRDAGIPMVDIINHRPETQSGFVAHWHTGDDNMDNIDKRTLRAVGQVVLAVVYNEAAGKI
ncbi:M28 family peptidase [Neolewinella agarilytica]|uniref:Peptidase family M28 n=1 Tax=Neolewinella agarilytica TaxID=478744 RepID=A0A1H9B9D9_9BACT|nr:M28 family peptidase [Neolewinella agarilytica]SEP85489.1 Peptidase family M28 [Neolewinella agarilytica]